MTPETISLAGSAETNTSVGVPVVGGGELLNMGLSVALVVAAILLLGWFYSRSRFLGGGASDVIKIVATRSLGTKERLIIVEIADQQILVGITSTAMQTLHAFDAPVCKSKETPPNSPFKGRLRKALREIRQ